MPLIIQHRTAKALCVMPDTKLPAMAVLVLAQEAGHHGMKLALTSHVKECRVNALLCRIVYTPEQSVVVVISES